MSMMMFLTGQILDCSDAGAESDSHSVPSELFTCSDAVVCSTYVQYNAARRGDDSCFQRPSVRILSIITIAYEVHECNLALALDRLIIM